MSQQSLQVDPLNSPHPIPWGWVLATLAAIAPNSASKLHYYRSQSLISPDNQYAAYSRIQMQVQHPQSRVSSILFIENLVTGDLQAITPASPLANNPFLTDETEMTDGTEKMGSISIIIPISWSERGDRLLAREFEALFGSDIASDYAVIVDRGLSQTSTIAPSHISYTNAVLLGWSQSQPSQVLFSAGDLGDENWQLWTVDVDGQTALAQNDRPLTFGQTTHSVWAGPQA